MVDRKKLVKGFSIILLIGLIFIIFMFSNDSGKVSLGKSRLVLNFITDITNNSHITMYQIRKMAHLFEYFILSIVMIFAFRNFRKVDKRFIYFVVLVCFIYACSDEIHQLFIIGRDFRITDIVIDSIGIFSGVFFYKLCGGVISWE